MVSNEPALPEHPRFFRQLEPEIPSNFGERAFDFDRSLGLKPKFESFKGPRKRNALYM